MILFQPQTMLWSLLDILLQRLEQCIGIKGTSLSWIKSHLSDRFHFVHMNDESSEQTIVKVMEFHRVQCLDKYSSTFLHQVKSNQKMAIAMQKKSSSTNPDGTKLKSLGQPSFICEIFLKLGGNFPFTTHPNWSKQMAAHPKPGTAGGFLPKRSFSLSTVS